MCSCQLLEDVRTLANRYGYDDVRVRRCDGNNMSVVLTIAAKSNYDEVRSAFRTKFGDRVILAFISGVS